MQKPAALDAEFARQRRQREYRAHAATAVLVSFRTVARTDDCRRRVAVEGCEAPDVFRIDSADGRRLVNGQCTRACEKCLGAADASLDKVAVKAAVFLQLRGQRKRQ